MRSTAYCFLLTAAAIAGCHDRNATNRTTPAARGSDAAPDANAGMRTSGGESDRAENPLNRRDASSPPVPSSAAPDIDAARGDDRSSGPDDKQ